MRRSGTRTRIPLLVVASSTPRRTFRRPGGHFDGEADIGVGGWVHAEHSEGADSDDGGRPADARHPSFVSLASDVVGTPAVARVFVLSGARDSRAPVSTRGAQRWDVPGSTFCRWRWVSMSKCPTWQSSGSACRRSVYRGRGRPSRRPEATVGDRLVVASLVAEGRRAGAEAQPNVTEGRCFEKPRSAATPLCRLLRPTGLPSRSALVAPPLRLAALRWSEAFLRKAPPTGSPCRACGSRAPPKENRPAVARRATGGCPVPVPRAPCVKPRRCQSLRAQQSPCSSCPMMHERERTGLRQG
jgi:hypothetical protein